MEIRVKAYPIFQSLQRPRLLLGTERHLVALSGCFSAFLLFVGMNRYTIALSIIWWFGSMYYWRKLSKLDPYFAKIYMRHIKQEEFYSARCAQVWRGELVGYKAR